MAEYLNPPEGPSAAPITAFRDGGEASRPKDIRTFPPLPVKQDEFGLSERTGEPRRTPAVTAATVLGYLSAAATAVMYARFWWRAAHHDTFSTSAQLLIWAAPPPGSWKAIVLVVALTAVAALMAAAPCVIAYNIWDGYRWTRHGGIVSVLIVAGGALLFAKLGWTAVVLAAGSAILAWLPQCDRFFQQWSGVRRTQPPPATGYQRVYYGPLPRYR